VSVGERDKKMSDIASIAAEAFAETYAPATNKQRIKSSPQDFLKHTIPYLTVRALHRQEKALDRQEKALDRQEKALKNLETDSRWIKWFAIATGFLTFVLVILTVILGRYALLDIIHSGF
jgi:hypothetical protein